MNLAAELAIATYYYGTLPVREGLRQRLEAAGKAPICVLFYHRIADTVPNDWTMTNAAFREQIQWLKHRFELVSLSEAQARIASGHNQRVAVTITFDDGYADNYQQAIPWLIEQQIPCTYFVSLDFILTGRPFPHDVAAGQPLAANSLAQLREMAQAGIDIGAHSRTHPDLAQMEDQAAVLDEVVTARDELSQWIDRPVNYFAFPFGKHENMTDQAFKMARDAGIQGVCSAYGNYNVPGDDPFHIQRIHGDPQMVRLKNWLTVDPRKFGRIPAYQVDWGG